MDKLEFDDVSFWYMHDNHTFTRLQGYHLLSIINQARRIRETSRWGMLCPALLTLDGKTISRIGACVHCYGDSKEADQKWLSQASDWMNEIWSHRELIDFLNKKEKEANVKYTKDQMVKLLIEGIKDYHKSFNINKYYIHDSIEDWANNYITFFANHVN